VCTITVVHYEQTLRLSWKDKRVATQTKEEEAATGECAPVHGYTKSKQSG